LFSRRCKDFNPKLVLACCDPRWQKGFVPSRDAAGVFPQDIPGLDFPGITMGFNVRKIARIPQNPGNPGNQI
jgi:hypothetical protein